MASKSLGTLTIDLIAKTGLFQEGLDKGGRAAQKFARDVGKQADQVEAAFDTAFKAVGIAAGVAFGAVSLAVKNSIEEMGQLVTYAKQVAMPIDDFSAFAEVAKNAEVSTDSFATSLRKLDQSLAQAKQGSAQYATAFKALGIDPAKISTTKQAFLAIADAFSKYRDDANKVAVAQQLLGRSGTEMIDFLDQGSAAIQKAADRQRDLGNALDENGAKKWEGYDDAVDEFHNTIDGLTKTLALDLLPAITDVTKEATGFIQSWNNNGGLKQATAAIKTLLDNLDAIAVFFASRFVVTKAIAGIVAIGDAATMAGTAIGTMRVALAALGGPVGLVATAIAGGITALIEYNKHFDEMRKTIDQSNDSLRTFLGLSGAAQFRQSGVLATSVQRDTEALKNLSTQIADVTKQRDAAFKDAAGSSWGAAGEASRGQLAALDGQLAKLKAQQKELMETRDKNQATLDQYRKDLANPNSALHAGQTRTPPLPGITLPSIAGADSAKDAIDKLTTAYDTLAKASNQYANSLTADDPLQKANDAMAAGVENLAKLQDAYVKAGGSAKVAQELFDKGLAGLKEKFTFDLSEPKRKLDAYTGSLRDQLDALKASNAAQLQSMTLGTQAAQDAQQLAQATQEATKAVTDFIQAHQLHPEAMSDKLYEQELAALKQNEADKLAAIKDFQEQAAALRENFDAGWQKSIADFIEQTNNKFQQGAKFAQDFTSGFADAFVEFGTHAKTAKEAFGDFIDTLYADALRFVANKAIAGFFELLQGTHKQTFDANALTNGFNIGGSGGNSGSGFWSDVGSIFSSMFGGGRAGGGPVAAGGLYQVNENGPELLAVGGRQYLMMGPQSGTVQPASRSRAPGGITLNQYIQPTSTRRTADQVATATSRQLRIAAARNG